MSVTGHWVRRGSQLHVYDVYDSDEAAELLPELGEVFAGSHRTPPRRTAPRRTSPSPASQLGRPLHGALHEPVDPTRATNKYPLFAPPDPAEAATVAWYAQKLSDQIFRATQGKVRLYVNPDHILVAPWISRINKRAASVFGSRRDTDAFWLAYRNYRGATVALLDPGHRVSAAYAAAMGWPSSTIGQKLIHHHIDNHAYVAAIPENLHKYAIHARREVIATPH